LLKQITETFSIDCADVDETPLPKENPWQTAERLAEAKARTVAIRNPNAIVIAGDTVVALEQDNFFRQLAKPADENDAQQMLRALSSRLHLVITGVCVTTPESEEVFSVTTTIEFRELSDQEINDYVATGEPMDKAGAYAIQGGAKGFVTKCDGSLTNVIGFPVDEIRAALERIAKEKA
jgi:septum formation protein